MVALSTKDVDYWEMHFAHLYFEEDLVNMAVILHTRYEKKLTLHRTLRCENIITSGLRLLHL